MTLEQIKTTWDSTKQQFADATGKLRTSWDQWTGMVRTKLEVYPAAALRRC